MTVAQKQQAYVLRGYIKERPNGRFVAVCLKPNLVVEGSTQSEAFRRLQQLIYAYIEDAVKDGHLEHFMAQRAPLRFHVEYGVGRLQGLALALKSFKPFTETCNIPQHA
jgi:predicted RNase H-like HicB family nuclease